jgi:hypothetical protein
MRPTKGKIMRTTKKRNPPMKKKLDITFDRDLDLESDHVLAYMIRVGASLDIDTYYSEH